MKLDITRLHTLTASLADTLDEGKSLPVVGLRKKARAALCMIDDLADDFESKHEAMKRACIAQARYFLGGLSALCSALFLLGDLDVNTYQAISEVCRDAGLAS